MNARNLYLLGVVGELFRQRIVAGIACSALVLVAGAADASSPSIQFDVSSTIECRDVTPPEFAAANPDERLFEARFQVSSLIRNGSEDDLIQYFYRIESPRQSLQIVDYQPRTTLASELAGNITIEDKTEDTKQLGVVANGHVDYYVKGTGTAAIGSKDNSTVRYEKLPPLELLSSSGTLQRGSGVYFKLKPSSQTSLEGGKEFVVVMRVPAVWRGDFVYLRCQALGYRRGVVRTLDVRTTSGTGEFLVALYAAGDEQAKATAARFVRAESQLRAVAVTRADEIEKQAYPSVVSRVGAVFAAVEPKIPPSWLTDVIYDTSSADFDLYQQRLPTDVREAARNYLAAKSELHGLCGGDVIRVKVADRAR